MGAHSILGDAVRLGVEFRDPSNHMAPSCVISKYFVMPSSDAAVQHPWNYTLAPLWLTYISLMIGVENIQRVLRMQAPQNMLPYLPTLKPKK